MAKSKATHYGECQCCGSRQKLPGGKLALHGYTVANHFFQGTCYGSQELPFEQSCELIREDIKRSKEYRRRLMEEIAGLRAPATDTTEAWMHVYHPYEGRTKSFYRWENIGIVTREEVILHQGTEHEYRYQSFFYMKKVEGKWNYTTRQIDPDTFQKTEIRSTSYGYAKTVPEIVQNMNEAHAKSIEDTVKRVDSHIFWQEQRIKNWAPKPLTAIE